MMIHHVEQVDVAVGSEIWAERKTEQAEIAPATHFFVKVDQRCGCLHTVFDNPDTPGTFPDIHATVVLKEQTHGLIPCSTNGLLAESRRQRGALRMTVIKESHH